MADKANEATVGDICQENHLQNLSPACHKSKAPVYEHWVDSFSAQSSTQQKLWIILTKMVLFPGILDIIDGFLFVGIFLKQKKHKTSKKINKKKRTKHLEGIIKFALCQCTVQIGQGNLEVPIMPVMCSHLRQGRQKKWLLNFCISHLKKTRKDDNFK